MSDTSDTHDHDVVDLMAALERSLQAARDSLREPEEDGFCCLTLARSGVCSCPDREQNVGR